MKFATREMTLDEAHLVIDYFHSSTPEHLEMLGVDPTRLPTRAVWADRFRQMFATPIDPPVPLRKENVLGAGTNREISAEVKDDAPDSPDETSTAKIRPVGVRKFKRNGLGAKTREKSTCRKVGGAEGTATSLTNQALSAPKPLQIPHCLAWRFLADSQTSNVGGIECRSADPTQDAAAAFPASPGTAALNSAHESMYHSDQ